MKEVYEFSFNLHLNLAAIAVGFVAAWTGFEYVALPSNTRLRLCVWHMLVLYTLLFTFFNVIS